jgi:hypothetical protein
MNYNLTINEEQAKLIKTALEEYFRIRMNQWSDLAEDLAHEGFVYNLADPENGMNFNDYLTRREHTEMLLKQAMMAAQPQRTYKVMEMPEKCLIAQDIWQVIRHQLYLDNGGVPNGWVVDARKPLQMSEEQLPVIERMEK